MCVCCVELYENLERAGASVKQYFVDGIRNMWQQLNELARAHTGTTPQEQSQQENESELCRTQNTTLSLSLALVVSIPTVSMLIYSLTLITVVHQANQNGVCML